MPEVVYPVSDGKPMAETDGHRQLMTDTVETLREFYRAEERIYVSGNNFLYWEEGNPKACVSPDVYVVFGVGNQLRDCYQAWKENGRLPGVVFEFTSRKTQRMDVQRKGPIYEQVLRVPEYFRFDPTGDYLNPRLQGQRLIGRRYVPLELVEGRLRSEQLALDLVMEGPRLRLYDPRRGEWLLTPAEQAAARVRAELAAREAEAARAAAEAARVTAEAARATETARRHEAEAARDAIEAERMALQAELETLRRRLGSSP
jgi:Uma2 family endonuclease